MTASETYTEAYTVPPTAYAAAGLRRLAERRWWVAALPVLLLVVASAANTAFLIVACLWIFVLLPPAVIAVYYRQLLNPAVASLTRRQRVLFEPDRLTVEFTPPDDADPVVPAPRPIIIMKADVASVDRHGSYLQFIMHGTSPVGMLLIPLGSLPPGLNL